MSEFQILRVGITGESGFIGKHLSTALDGTVGVERIPFERLFWEDERRLSRFVGGCDVILHLAFVNRNPDPSYLYETNVSLTQKLADALERSGNVPAVIYASSIRERENTAYGRSKAVCREVLEAAMKKREGMLESLRIPNVFGPGAPAYDNSFIATFSHQLLTGQTPVITEERKVPLLYVRTLCERLKDKILRLNLRETGIYTEWVVPEFHLSVRETLTQLERFAAEYRRKGSIAVQPDPNLANLRETFLWHTYRR
jgi:UDP-2-acetamido-2,6-beta-L-arabino-hexul-4-ose reductase